MRWPRSSARHCVADATRRPGACAAPTPTCDLALFDFDGTITTRETMPDFMRAAVRPGRQRLGWLLLAPLIIGYKARLVPGPVVRAAICMVGFRGVAAAELERHGAAFARDVLPGLLRPEAMARIAWHRARGDRVVVVSGGLDAYLRPWADTHGLELLCSTLEQRAGVLTGRYQGAQCVGAEKVRRVLANCPPAAGARVHAYGDTPEDAAMLSMAHERHYRVMPGADAAANAVA